MELYHFLINAPYVSLVWNQKVIATVQNLTCLIGIGQNFFLVKPFTWQGLTKSVMNVTLLFKN